MASMVISTYDADCKGEERIILMSPSSKGKANSSPEIKDNTLNSTEKKIVARAVLAEIISNFNYEPEDLR